MIDKLIKEISEKYNLEISYQIKYMNVYIIKFKLEGNEVSFVFMYDNLTCFDNNLKELEHKVNDEIIYYYKRRKK